MEAKLFLEGLKKLFELVGFNLTESDIKNFADIFSEYIISDIVNQDILAYQNIPTKLAFEFKNSKEIIEEFNKNSYKRIEIIDFFLFNHEKILLSEKKKKSGLSFDGSEYRGWADTSSG